MGKNDYQFETNVIKFLIGIVFILASISMFQWLITQGLLLWNTPSEIGIIQDIRNFLPNMSDIVFQMNEEGTTINNTAVVASILLIGSYLVAIYFLKVVAYISIFLLKTGFKMFFPSLWPNEWRLKGKDKVKKKTYEQDP